MEVREKRTSLCPESVVLGPPLVTGRPGKQSGLALAEAKTVVTMLACSFINASVQERRRKL